MKGVRVCVRARVCVCKENTVSLTVANANVYKFQCRALFPKTNQLRIPSEFIIDYK